MVNFSVANTGFFLHGLVSKGSNLCGVDLYFRDYVLT